MSINIKKLIVVVPYFYPKIGGLENYAYNIARRLHESGDYCVSVITSNHETKEYRKEMIDDMVVYRLPIRYKISNTPINFSWYGSMRRIFNAERPDIVHVHSPVPFMADIAILAAKKVPVVFTYHAGSMVKGIWPIDLIIRLYERTVLRFFFWRAAVIVSVSDHFAKKELKRFANKTFLIPPGVDTKRFTPTPLPTHSKIITFVGRIELSSKWKGIEQLLQAVAFVIKRHPDTKLDIIGGGDAIPYYRNIAKKLGIEKHVIFCGPQTGEDLVAAYRRTTVVVLPSTSNSESFGMVLIEAMASGRPVIGSNIGGIHQSIDHEKNGFLVPPGDPKELASAIEGIFNDHSLAQKLAEASLQKSKQFDWNIQLVKYRELFDKILEKNNNIGPIAHVTAYYPPHTGGLEVVVQEVSEELAKQTFTVKVFTSTIGAEKKPKKESTGNHFLRRLRSFEVAHTPIIWSLPFHLLCLPRRSLLHVHVAHAGIPEIALIVAKLRGFRTVAHFHLDIGPSGSFGILLPLYKKYILGTVLRHVDKVIIFTPEQSLLVQDKYRVKKNRVAIIPNGIGERFFYRDTRNLPRKKLKLLFVGRFSAQKRLDRLIDALALLKIPCHLTIVGDGEDRKKIEQQAQRLGLTNISFEGAKTREDVQTYYRNADVFVISSDIEGMPLVVLEAMATGLPILASDVLGLRELVKGVGVLVDDPYPENFSTEITKLWQSPERLRDLSLQSLKKAEELSLNNVVKMIKNIYKEVQK